MVEDYAGSSPRIRCVSSAKLAHFLKREPRSDSATDLDLNRIFRELLRRAIDFLPSDAGTIYLDDPLDTTDDTNRGSLVVIASFGPKTEDLIEERFDTHKGIIGEVYRTGLPYSCIDPLADPIFRSGPGMRIGFSIKSVVCAPLEVDGRTIHTLDEIGTFIWAQIDGRTDLVQIVAEICRVVDVAEEVAAADLDELLTAMASKDLVTLAS